MLINFKILPPKAGNSQFKARNLTKLETLKQYFGYDSFRNGQETLIDGIIAGRDVLGVMPIEAEKLYCQ